MAHYIPIALGLLGAYLLYYGISTIISNRYHARKARELGAEPPFVRSYRLPLGIDLLQQIIAADKEKRVPPYLLESHKQIGRHTWLQPVLGSEMYFTSDPKNIQAMLATQFHDFELGVLRTNSLFPMLGYGIFTLDGKAWEHSRAMLRPQFARQQVSDLELEEVHVQNMLKHLPTTGGWTGSVDVVPLFFRLTLDSATEFLFGQSVGSQLAALNGGETKKSNEGGLDWTLFGPAFDRATHFLGERLRLGEMYWLWDSRDFRKDCNEIKKFADYYVSHALTSDPATLAEGKDGHAKERYIFLSELAKITRDPIELRSQLLNILLAGRDTTAGLLGYTFYFLVRNKSHFQKLRKTIIDDFGTYKKPKNITFETLKNCTLLQHTMNETLRLRPMVPINGRRATKDTTIPRGGGPDGNSPLYVRKGQEVTYSIFVTHNSADIWGPDVEEFKPERWIGRKPGWEFLPFNGGPRICLGQQFALTEAGYVIVRLLQKFDLMETDETDPVERHALGLTTTPARLPLRLHEAEE